ncbi:HK97 gp10 family phage protein [Acinetobacter tibetensis]|uniref:HK97 gp10 family phage protein n=1 Tax=Acinetobacter tibetensis TaxID=2943497 RepID=UPI003A4D5F22
MALRNRQVREVKLKLERLKKLPQVLDQELNQIAHEVQQTARDMAPIQYGGLKRAIQVRRTAAPQKGAKGFQRGKSSFQIYINPMTPAPGHKEGVVGGYAWLVHEHMGWAGVPNVIMPSAISVAAGNGEVVGGKFLDRAMQKHRGKIRGKLTRTTRKFINH